MGRLAVWQKTLRLITGRGEFRIFKPNLKPLEDWSVIERLGAERHYGLISAENPDPSWENGIKILEGD